jgi:hypothetical protein
MRFAKEIFDSFQVSNDAVVFVRRHCSPFSHARFVRNTSPSKSLLNTHVFSSVCRLDDNDGPHLRNLKV